MQISPSLAQTLTNLNLPPYPSVTGLAQPITLRSLASFAGALAWASLLLVSFTGWGRVTGKLFRVPRLPVSVACSLGIAAIVFLGGWLNLAHAIYPSALFAITGVGLVLYAASRSERPEEYRWLRFWKSSSRASKILIVIALLILVVRVAATVRLASFDATDDGSAYLAFPNAMLAYHHFTTGPFNDRHIISSVGGGYWLQAFVVAATSLANIGMADRTLGLLLLFVAIWDVGIAFDLSTEQLAIIEVLAYLVPQITTNLTFVMLPIALLLSLLWLVFQTPSDESAFPWRYAVLAGAIGGAVVALKSTFLPCVGSFCLLPYCAMNWRRKKDALGLPVLAGVGAVLVLAAWMLAMKLTDGTYLYPILGHGLDHTKSGVFGAFAIAKTPRTVIKLFLQACVLLSLAAAVLTLRLSNRRALFCLGVTTGAAVGITAFNIAAGGDSIWRYGFPQFFSAILIYSVVMTALAREVGGLHRKRFAITMGILPLIGCLFYFDVSGAHPQLFREVRWESAHYRDALRASLTDQSLSSPSISAEYRATGSAVPENATLLENVAYPFLFRDQTHKIFLLDWPGAAGPAPGWPFGVDAATLAQYLQRSSVQYVAYDYRFARWFDARSCQAMERPQSYSAELYVLLWMSVLAHNQLDHLRTHYKSIYDDGKIAVIDLNQPIAGAVENESVWTPKTSKEDMCSVVLARYLANPSVRTSTNSTTSAESR